MSMHDGLPTHESQMESMRQLLSEKQEHIQALEQQNAALERRLHQVDDAFIVRWITVKDGDYKKAINDLITWEIQVHDDPAVSSRARDVQKLVEAARAIEPYCQCPIPAINQSLAEALKPFEQEKR